jgi:flagellin
MGFRINTNIAALNAHTSAMLNNKHLDTSLSRLSSGLRINTAADDASGMAIADSLRSQASALGQAISNGNDAIGIVQTADKAMDEQLKILDTIKVKATQAAQDGQTAETRKYLQADITRLMEQLDNIASQTTFNGQALLSGSFTNKEFQVGAYSNQAIKATIGATSSDKIGHTRFETGKTITAAVDSVSVKLIDIDGENDIETETVKISTSAGTGLGVLAEAINKVAGETGVRASFSVESMGSASIASGTLSGLTLNGINIGVVEVQKNDNDGALVAAINEYKDTTGIVASTDKGRLILTSNDGRGIMLSGTNLDTVTKLAATQVENYGRLTLTKLGGQDLIVSGTGVGAAISAIGFNTVAEKTVNLRDIRGAISSDIASAIGAHNNSNTFDYTQDLGAGVTSLVGAMAVMDISEAATKALDKVRADLGSVQNQLTATINNISVTQVNVKAAESNIRDVDFASESASFSKYNILAQSGSYAMSQANAVQQNVLRLLQ